MPNYPLLKLKPNESAEVKLLFDDFKSGTSDRGQWWLYGIEIDGVRHNWFPGGAAHDVIQSAGYSKGSTFTVSFTDKGEFVINGQGTSTLEVATDFRLEKMVEKIGVMVKRMYEEMFPAESEEDEGSVPF